MGVPYLPTLTYQYVARPKSLDAEINLKNRLLIIDGNSMMYYIYDKAVKDDKKLPMKNQLTKTPFGYDGYRKILYEVFSQFKNKCAGVTVVFDGVYQRHKRRRADPERTSSIRYAPLSGCGNRKPSLFKHQMNGVLKDLGIERINARGEADPMIVALAKERNAVVVAGDSDYHLYDLSQGYVPLRYLDLKQLRGPVYQMQDVFEGMSPRAVALWASLIGYDFVSLEDLKVRLIYLHIPF